MSLGTVLVTGGAGFIGVNLAPILSAAGWRTRCFDNYSTGRETDAERAGYHERITGDVRDRAQLTEATRGCSHVVHLAAQAGVPSSVADPVADHELNVLGTLNALLAARDSGAERFVFASSNAPLGEVEPPANERIVPRPTSPYGASKLAGEGYCSAFAGTYGLGTLVLRFANVYGPWSYHKGSVVASLCKQAMADRPLVIYGDGRQTRDFVFVGDVCKGIAAGLGADASGEVMHLGTGIETPVSSVVELVMKGFPDRQLEVRHEPPRAGDIVRNCADISRARARLGYEPATSLADGLGETVSWFREVYSA